MHSSASETIVMEERRMEEDIRRQAELFDTEQQAVIGTTLEGAIVYWNAAAERLYGWSADEVLGRNVVEVTPTSMLREEAEKIMQLLQSGRSWSGLFEVRSRSGEEFAVRVRDLPVTEAEGRLIGVVGISSREPG